MKKIFYYGTLIFILNFMSACSLSQGNKGQLPTFAIPVKEADWIVAGEPIEFEGQNWYPKDGVETLLDSEVYPVANFKGVDVFVEKIDVRPFNRLYTKFGSNKFRYFEQSKPHD